MMLPQLDMLNDLYAPASKNVATAQVISTILSELLV